MTRINIIQHDDETGREVIAGWFNPDKATTYSEGTRWDGNNHISLATGSQWNHETLYRTAGGRWVVEATSQWQNSRDTYRFAREDEAREWLIRNEYDEADIEAATGDPLPPEMGRREIGPAIKIRITPEVLERVDELAAAEDITRSAWIRRALEAAAERPTPRESQ